jgi:hypothetical protein
MEERPSGVLDVQCRCSKVLVEAATASAIGGARLPAASPATHRSLRLPFPLIATCPLPPPVQLKVLPLPLI